MTSVTGPNVSEQILALVEASRPPGWCFAPILFTIGLIHSHSFPANFTAKIMAVAQMISLSFPLCIVVFGMNDVYDYDSDVRNPRKTASGLEGGVLDPVYHPRVRLAAQISTAFIFTTSFITLRPHNIIATTLLVLLGWQYSASPLRLKEVPVFDSLSNGAIVLLAWFVGYTFGRESFSGAPSKGYVLAICASGVHALGSVVDIESDVAAGQRTIATFLGPRFAAVLGALTFALALFVEQWNSIFGAYLCGGLITMLLPCMCLQWAHQAFKAVVYWTVSMSMLWFVSKALPMR